MKKVYVLGLITALLIGGGVGYTARANNALFNSRGRLEANDVIYDASDFDTIVNIYEAEKINSYNLGFVEGKNIGQGAKGIGSLQGVSSGTIDCTGIDEWENLTTDDFVYGIERVSSSISRAGCTNGSWSMPNVGNQSSGTSAVSMSYNQATGQLTVSGGMVYTEFYSFFAGNVAWYHNNGDAYYDNLYAGCNITTVNKLTVYLKK